MWERKIFNEDLIVAKIAIEAAGSEHTVFGNAYNMIGGYMQDHIGIYIQKDLKPSNEVEAVFYAMSLVRRKFKVTFKEFQPSGYAV